MFSFSPVDINLVATFDKSITNRHSVRFLRYLIDTLRLLSMRLLVINLEIISLELATSNFYKIIICAPNRLDWVFVVW